MTSRSKIGHGETPSVRSVRKREPVVWVGSVLAFSVLTGALGCGKGEQKPSIPPVPVVVGEVKEMELPLSLQAIGTVEPIEAVSVRAQIGGILTHVGFEEGEDVEKGQVLFQIDPRPFEAALGEAKAALAKDRAQAKNAELQLKRYEALVEKEYASKEQYDLARTQAEALAATVEQDEQAVKNAELPLEYATIRSPISGRTGSLLVKKGNLVKANDTSSMVVINQLHPIHVRFSVPEKNLPEIQANAARGPLGVRVTPASGPHADAEGKLTFLDNAVDPTTGTVTLKGQFENAAGSLWPGQFVNVELVLAMEPHAIAAPSQAIVNSQTGTFCFVVKADGTVEKRDVTVQRTVPPWSVIEKGLAPGEKVVTDGQLRLVDKSKVEIKASLQGAAEAK